MRKNNKFTKRLLAALAITCMTTFTSPVFAAPETFADVPAHHWSYAAVQQLAKDGIVSGDAGRFNGDRTVTRYEMAVMVANAMTKMEKVDAKQKAVIEKLMAEYDSDLQQIGARLKKVEAQAARAEAKAKVNFFFDNRIEYNHTSLSPSDNGSWAGGTGKIDQQGQFMERIRVYMNVPVGDKWEWNSRLVQAKWNFNNPTTDTSVRFDRFWMTGKDLLGGNFEIGKMWLYPGKGAFYGNTGDTEGMYYTTKLDKLTMRLGNGRNTAITGQTGRDVSFVEATYRPTNKMDIGAYVLQQDALSGFKDMKISAINGAAELMPGLALSFEYAKNDASNNALYGFTGKQSGYFVALQSKYAATNFMPALYTSMVNPFVQGDHGWGVSYRHLPSGVAGYLNRGAFSWVPLTTDDDGTWQNTFNGVNAWRFDYIYVPWKNVQWTFTYDRIKPITGTWVNNSIQSTLNFFF